MKKMTFLMFFLVVLATGLGIYYNHFAYFLDVEVYSWHVDVYAGFFIILSLALYSVAFVLLRLLYKNYALSFNRMFSYLTIILLIAAPLAILDLFILTLLFI